MQCSTTRKTSVSVRRRPLSCVSALSRSSMDYDSPPIRLNSNHKTRFFTRSTARHLARTRLCDSMLHQFAAPWTLTTASTSTLNKYPRNFTWSTCASDCNFDSAYVTNFIAFTVAVSCLCSPRTHELCYVDSGYIGDCFLCTLIHL